MADMEFTLVDQNGDQSKVYTEADRNAGGLIELGNWANRAVAVNVSAVSLEGNHLVLLDDVTNKKWPLTHDGNETDCVMVDPFVSGFGDIDLTYVRNNASFVKRASGARVVTNPRSDGSHMRYSWDNSPHQNNKGELVAP